MRAKARQEEQWSAIYCNAILSIRVNVLSTLKLPYTYEGESKQHLTYFSKQCIEQKRHIGVSIFLQSSHCVLYNSSTAYKLRRFLRRKKALIVCADTRVLHVVPPCRTSKLFLSSTPSVSQTCRNHRVWGWAGTKKWSTVKVQVVKRFFQLLHDMCGTEYRHVARGHPYSVIHIVCVCVWVEYDSSRRCVYVAPVAAFHLGMACSNMTSRSSQRKVRLISPRGSWVQNFFGFV